MPDLTHLQREKDVQREIRDYYRLAGCIVYDLSQGRKTRQTPGLPDLYVMLPRQQRTWWHEVKTATGKLEGSQEKFLEQARACGVRVVVGGVAEAIRAVEVRSAT